MLGAYLLSSLTLVAIVQFYIWGKTRFFVRQPVAPAEFYELLDRYDYEAIPIALDESVSTEALARRCIEQKLPVTMVLKPMTIGGVLRTQELLEDAKKAKLRIVLSSAMDSGIAASAYRHLAATMGNSDTAHGIATHRLLETDTVNSDTVNENAYEPIDSQSFGLGVKVRSQLDTLWVNS